jgi:predicted dehydrogenase
MMVKFLLGSKPQEVVAIASSRGNFPEIIDNIQCLVRYSDKIDCGIWYSKTALGYRNGLSLRVFGSKGSAEWIQANPEYINYANNVGGRYVLDRASSGIQIANQPRYQRFKAGHPAGFLEAFANYYVDIAEALNKYKESRGGNLSDYVFGVKESIEGLEMLEAITRSSQSRKWEAVSRLAAHEVENEKK